jgi:hypothetical protein
MITGGSFYTKRKIVMSLIDYAVGALHLFPSATSISSAASRHDSSPPLLKGRVQDGSPFCAQG